MAKTEQELQLALVEFDVRLGSTLGESFYVFFSAGPYFVLQTFQVVKHVKITIPPRCDIWTRPYTYCGGRLTMYCGLSPAAFTRMRLFSGGDFILTTLETNTALDESRKVVFNQFRTATEVRSNKYSLEPPRLVSHRTRTLLPRESHLVYKHNR